MSTTKAVAVKTDPHAVTVQSESAAVLSMIERIAAAPDIPVERIEQMFSLYTKMEAERARRAYHAAFAQMQPELPAVERKGTSHNGKFARFEDIHDAIMPILRAHGFGLSFRMATEPGKVNIACILSHKDGHAESTEHPFPYDTSGSKNAIQSIGSATSYGKRYTASALLGIATRNEDDDGKAAGTGEVITEDQFIELADLMREKSVPLAKFLAVEKISELSALPKSRFEQAKRKLEAVR